MVGEEHRKQAFVLEARAREADGLLARARAYEEAARAYFLWSNGDRDRCAAEAQRLLSEADRRARDALPVAELRRLEKRVRRLMGAGDSAPDIQMDGDTISVRDTTGMLPDALEAHDALLGAFAALCAVDVGNRVERDLLDRVMRTAGDTSSYCPTPICMPIWVVTTTWRKTLLALVVAALIGAPAGMAAAGETDAQAALIGVLGAETGVFLNLLATYLTQSKRERRELEGLLDAYERTPITLGVILQLRRGRCTANEVAEHLHIPVRAARRILSQLEADGTVKKDGKGPRGAWLWKLR